MTAGDLVARLKILGCTYDVLHLVDPDGNDVAMRRLQRVVDGRTLSAVFEVEDAQLITDGQIRSICNRLRLTPAQKTSVGLP
jgi:hypothetical protein